MGWVCSYGVWMVAMCGVCIVGSVLVDEVWRGRGLIEELYGGSVDSGIAIPVDVM